MAFNQLLIVVQTPINAREKRKRKKRSFAHFVFNFCSFRFCDYNTPEYIEDIRSLDEGNNFLWIARKGKLGVLKLYYKKGFFHSDYVASRIIPCKYDMIEDRGDYYLCYEGNKKVMFDRRGTQIE